MSLGVDLYRYQTVTDYRALASVAAFAWVKLTDGTGPAVVRGDGQVNGCRAAGIPVGGYHYAQPGNPEQQAGIFLAECRRVGALDIAPALDVESPFTPTASTRDFAVRFCKAVAAAGHRPAVYLSASWAGQLRPDQWGIPGLVIWLAAYGSNDGHRYPAAVTRYYSGRYDVHQYTSVGQVAGIRGNVDVNESLTDIRNRKEDDMFEDADRADLRATAWRLDALLDMQPKVADHPSVPEGVRNEPVTLVRWMTDLEAKLDALSVGGVDLDALVARLGPAVAKAVNDEFARRQAE